MNDSRQVFYECQRCGNCCRWPGLVRVGEEEIAAMADFLKVEPDFFIQEYCEIHPNRRGLIFKNKPDHACIFLDGINTCRIQEVKPIQCQGFPNTWNFPGWQEVCEAIPVSVEQQAVGDQRSAVSPKKKPMAES